LQGENQRSAENTFHLFGISEGCFSTARRKFLKKFPVHLLKQVQKWLLADSRKFLPSNHYYKFQIAFWHISKGTEKIFPPVVTYHGNHIENAKRLD